MFDHSSPVLFTMYVGIDVGGGLGGGIFAMWLAMVLWTSIFLALVLYMCNSGTVKVLPSYGCGNYDINSVSSGMTWGSIWGSLLFARPGVIVTFAFLITL